MKQKSSELPWNTLQKQNTFAYQENKVAYWVVSTRSQKSHQPKRESDAYWNKKFF